MCVGIRKFPFDSRGRREIVLKILEIDESNPSLSSAHVVNKLIFVGILHKNKIRQVFWAREIVSTNVMGLPLAGLISPLLSLPLTVPAVSLLGE